MKVDFDTRVAQVCASLVSEGHIITGQLGMQVCFFRHPNGRRLAVIADPPFIFIRENGHTIKSEKVPIVHSHPVT